ncbi:ADP-ribosyltransferase [Mycobacterium sp. NPDC003449]
MNDPFRNFPYAVPANQRRQLGRLTDGERVAIESFALNGHERINSALRGQREMSTDIENAVDQIRSGLRKYPLSSDVRVTREVSGTVFGVVGPHAAASADQLVGQVFDEQGFMSTSMSPIPAHSERRRDPLTLDLLVPAGTPALAVGELSRVFPRTRVAHH